MFECNSCKRSFITKHAFNSHWGQVCKPGANSKENKRNAGKKGKNQYTKNPDLWKSVPFEKLGRGKRREILLEKNNHSCSSCGYNKTREDGKSILEIDHIDGNHLNNVEDNLRVLCPNCHAMTPNFRNWGREFQKKTSSRNRPENKDYKEQKRLQNEMIISKILEIHALGVIDFTKVGWLQKLSKEIGVSHTTIGVKLKKFMPDWYNENCLTRVSALNKKIKAIRCTEN